MTDSPRPAQVDHRIFEVAYEQRQAIRERFPMLPAGIVGNELYARHVAILGGEPDFREMWELVDQIAPHDESFGIDDLTATAFYSALKVQAYFWFAEMCGLIRCVGKNSYVTLVYEAVNCDGDEFSFPENLVMHGMQALQVLCDDNGIEGGQLLEDRWAKDAAAEAAKL